MAKDGANPPQSPNWDALGHASGRSWLFGPAGLPEEVLARLRGEIRRALALPEVRERLHAGGGLEPYATTPEEFAALIRRDYDRFGRVIRDARIKSD